MSFSPPPADFDPFSQGLAHFQQSIQSHDLTIVDIPIPALSSGGTPTGAWWSLSGGDQNIEIVTYPEEPIVMTLAALAGGHQAFAFPNDPDIDPGLPNSAPLISLGVLGVNPAAGSTIAASGPIFAFASPGTRVGDWQATVTVVPEPASLLLAAYGLATVLGLSCKSRRFFRPPA